MNHTKTKKLIILVVIVLCIAVAFYIGRLSQVRHTLMGGLDTKNVQSDQDHTAQDRIESTIKLPEKTSIYTLPQVDQWRGPEVIISAKMKIEESPLDYIMSPSYLAFNIRCDMKKNLCGVDTTFFQIYTRAMHPETVNDDRIRVSSEHMNAGIIDLEKIDLSDINNPKGKFKIDLGSESGLNEYLHVDLANKKVFYANGCNDDSCIKEL